MKITLENMNDKGNRIKKNVSNWVYKGIRKEGKKGKMNETKNLRT
jgi:hypothetical protein